MPDIFTSNQIKKQLKIIFTTAACLILNVRAVNRVDHDTFVIFIYVYD